MGFGTKMAIGGALAGLGQGMVTNAQNDIEMKRQQALEAMKAKYRTEEAATQHGYDLEKTDKQYELADRNDSRKTERDLSADTVRASQKFGHEKNMKILDFKTSVQLETVKSKLRGIEGKEAALIEDALNNNELHSIEEGADGSLHAFFKNGSQVRTSVKAAPKTSSGEPSAITQARGGPAPAAKSAAAPAPRAAPAAKPSGQAVTKAQVQELAKTHKMTYAQAEAWAKSNGFQVR